MSSFLYIHTDELGAARHFYTTLLGLPEIYHSKAEQTVGYKIGTLQLAIAAHPEAAKDPHWATQLGWVGGTSARASWGFELDGEHFSAVVEGLRSADVVAWDDDPAWVGYWSYPVRDPMGNTVEITSPSETAWPAG